MNLSGITNQRASQTADATEARRRRRAANPSRIAAWLGAAAVALGLGAALTSGHMVANADNDGHFGSSLTNVVQQ